MRKVLICAAILSLSACSFIDSVLSPSPNVVASLESTVAALDQGALTYVQLPKCGSSIDNGSVICSDPAVVKQIGLTMAAAYTAVEAARANETASTVQAAQNAVTAYQAIINSIP